MNRNFLNILWDMLCSVKLTLFLLILLAFSSVFGTLIPQNEGTIQFAEKMGPGLARFFYSLQLFDLYHSVWFRLIILCLVFNLIACSFNRFPSTLKLFWLKPKPDRSKPFESLPADRSLNSDRPIEETIEKVKITLKKKYKNIASQNTQEGSYFYIDKGRYSLFGVYLVHLSVLIILIGAIIGSFSGFKGYVNILEGDSVDTVNLRNSSGHRHRDLGFTLHCDDFSVDFYKDGTPKEYRSMLRFTIDNKNVYEGLLKVNHPIKFHGITFYQSSYGSTVGDRAKVKVFSNKTQSYQVKEIISGVPVPLPENDGEFILIDIRNDFMRMGPAVSIIIIPSVGEERQVWLFKNHETIKKRFPDIFENFAKLNPSIYKPYTFSLTEIESKFYTGIQVTKDPGITFVYAGFLIIVLGLFISFFTSHRRIWIRVLEKNNAAYVQVAGTANKNPVGIERELDQIIKYLHREIKL